MKRTLTLTFAIGVLALAVGAVTVTNNLQTAQAQKDCIPYGRIVSNEARTTDETNAADTGPGFGDEVAPFTEGGLQDIREPGSRNTNPRSNCGQSNEPHGNN
jgi:hypothetical protein